MDGSTNPSMSVSSSGGEDMVSINNTKARQRSTAITNTGNSNNSTHDMSAFVIDRKGMDAKGEDRAGEAAKNERRENPIHGRRAIFRSITPSTFPLSAVWSLAVSKLLLLLTLLLRLVLLPLRIMARFLFPMKEFDGVNNLTIADKAAKAFVQYVTKTYLVGLRSEDSNTASQTTSDDEQCPFVETGYTKTIMEISSTFERFNSALNSSTRSRRSTSNSDSFSTDDPNFNYDENDDLFRASQSPPILLIYLHSPLHKYTPTFLSSKLLHPQTLSLLHFHRREGTLVCWGSSIHTADGASVSSSLGASSFPFLAMVRLKSSSTSLARGTGTNSTTGDTNINNKRINMEIHLRLQGPELASISLPTLQQHISTTVIRHQQYVSQSLSSFRQRLEERRLRQEQDMEYQRSLEEDRKKALIRQEEEERKLMEEMKQQEEERRKIQDKVDRIQNARNRVKRSQEMLEEELGKSLGGSTSSVTRIRFTVPSGQRVEQKFAVHDKIESLRAFMVIYFEEKLQEGLLDKEIVNFDLFCSYPKKKLDSDDLKLKEVEGLCPHAVVMVQDLDA